MQSIFGTLRPYVRFGALLVALLLLLSPVPAARAATHLLIIEAEHANENVPRSDYRWETASREAGYAGHGYVVVLPTQDRFFPRDEAPTASPELRYAITLPADDTYSVWVRSNNPNQDGNSVYVGLDGTIAAGIGTSYAGQWRWSHSTVNGERAQVSARAGSHTLNIWAREAGQRLDRILLTTDRSYTPTGFGPNTDDDSGSAPTPAPPAPAPTTNPGGCASGEVFVDAQDWWMPGEGQHGNDFGHTHVSLCFPHNKAVRGRLTFTIITKLHHNPGIFYGLNVSSSRSVSDQRNRCSDSGALACWRDRANPRTLARCLQTGGTFTDHNETCIWTDKITINTRDFGSDGWKEIRVRAFVREPDGNEQRVSTGLLLNVVNGLPRRDYRSVAHGYDSLEGRGWYGDGVNYTTATIEQPPMAPVKGVWEPEVHLDHGAEGIPATGWYAALDTDFHNGNGGQPLCPNGVRGQGETARCGNGPLHGT